MKEQAAESSDSKMYVAGPTGATRPRSQRKMQLVSAGAGATIGVAIWVLLFTLGVPWVLHIGAFDGVLPCGALGAVLGWFRLNHFSILVGAALAILLLVVAYTPIIVEPAKSFIRNDPLPDHADAIMVLSAGVSDDGMISPAAVDRLIKGLQLFRRGIAPVIVLSREAYNVDGKTVSSRQDQERIVSLLPNGMSHLVVAGITHSTRDEAVSARNLFVSRKWKRMIVVTSPLHTRRACAAFEKVGVTVTCVASETRDFSFPTLPTPFDRVSAFQLWLYETAGTIRYREAGWI